MIQLNSYLNCTDKTSVVGVTCIKVVGSFSKRIAYLGDMIIVCVQKVNIRKYVLLKDRLQKKFRVGSIHRGLLLRSKVNFKRINGVFFRFNRNQCAIIGRNYAPLSNKVYGPVLKEFCYRWPSLGCTTMCVL